MSQYVVIVDATSDNKSSVLSVTFTDNIIFSLMSNIINDVSAMVNKCFDRNDSSLQVYEEWKYLENYSYNCIDL